MVYHGHVTNGYIRLEGDVRLPEGLRVRIEAELSEVPRVNGDASHSLIEHYAGLIGAITDMPADAAENKTKHLYGRD